MLNSAEKMTLQEKTQKVSVWLTSYSLLTQKFSNPTKLQLPNSLSIQHFILQENCAYAISESGQVFIWGNLSKPESNFIQTLNFLQIPPIKLSKLQNIRISHMACNNSVALFLSEDGTLYSYGEDTLKFGLLGHGEVYSQPHPNPINSLFDHCIKHVSIGYSHACAINSSGQFFTWGTGKNGQLGIPGQEKIKIPKKVISKEKIQKSICSYNYTALLTCIFLYFHYVSLIGDSKIIIYGTLKNSTLYYYRNSNILSNIDFLKSPINSTPQIIDLKIQILKIVSGEGFLAILSNMGKVAYINEELQNFNLMSKHFINDITSCESKIYGLANEGLILYEWKPWLQDKFSEEFAMKIYRIHDKLVSYKGFCDLASSGGTTGLYYHENNISNLCISPTAKLTPPRLDLYESRSSLSSSSKDDLVEYKNLTGKLSDILRTSTTTIKTQENIENQIFKSETGNSIEKSKNYSKRCILL